MRESNRVSRKVASLASLFNPTKRGSIMKSIHESVGKTFDSNKCGKFVVEEYKNANNVKVRFTLTGGIKKTKMCHVRSGNVRDDMMPVVYGVGFIGIGPFSSRVNGKKTICYHKWNGMLQRCYSAEYHNNKPTYRDCTVCDEWHNFQNFAKWFYENYPNDGNEYHLDKDIKIKGNKTYSPDACSFVTASENNIESHALSYSLISPSGEVVFVYNLSEFCRNNNLTQSAMSLMVNGKRKSHKGWRLNT